MPKHAKKQYVDRIELCESDEFSGRMALRSSVSVIGIEADSGFAYS